MNWQHRWHKMRPSIFPPGAKQKGFLPGTNRAVSLRYLEFHHAHFEHGLGRARLGGQFGRLARRCRRSRHSWVFRIRLI